jgi:hypothetical protein
MHAGITAITELAVESSLTNRLPPDNAKQSFFLALSPLPKRRQFGSPRARKRGSQHHVIGCKTSRNRLRCWLRPARRTKGDQKGAHRRSDRRRDSCAARAATEHVIEAVRRASERFQTVFATGVK